MRSVSREAKMPELRGETGGSSRCVSDLCPAAVDEQLDPRDETRVVGAQKQGRLCHLVGLTRAAHWNRGHKLLHHFLRLRIQQRRCDRSGTQNVAANMTAA